MTTKKDTADLDPHRITLVPHLDGSLAATYQWHIYRFLMSDGSTIDVHAVRDDSTLRGEVVAYTKAEIRGSVELPDAPVEEGSTPSKRPAKRPPG